MLREKIKQLDSKNRLLTEKLNRLSVANDKMKDETSQRKFSLKTKMTPSQECMRDVSSQLYTS